MKGGGGKNIITYKLTEWTNIFRGSENNYTPCGSEDEEMARIRTWIKCQVSDLHFSHKPGHFQNSASHFSWRSEHRCSQDTYIWTAILGWFWEKITHFPGCDNGAAATKRKFHFIVEAHINMWRGEMTGCLMSVWNDLRLKTYWGWAVGVWAGPWVLGTVVAWHRITLS